MDTKIFLETLESLGFKAEIEQDEEYIKLNLDKEESYFRARLEEKHIYYSLYRIENEKIGLLFIHWLQYLADKENKQLVLERNYKKKDEIIQLLEQNGYKEMDQTEKELYVLSSLAPRNMCNREGMRRNKYYNGTYKYEGNIYLKKESEKEIKILFHLYATVEKTLQKFYQNEPFFFYQKNYSLFDFDYYAWGEKGEIEVLFEDRKMYLSFTKENDSNVKKMQFSTVKDLEFFLRNWAERTKRKQGIKQLFEPNEETFFFEKLMYSEDFSIYIPEHMEKQVHTYMLQFHTNEQLEEIASKYIKTKSPTIHELPASTYYFHFDEKVYLVDENREEVYALDDSPKIKEEIKMFLMNILESELNDTLNLTS